MRNGKIFVGGLLLAMSFAMFTGCGKKAEDIVDSGNVIKVETKDAEDEVVSSDNSEIVDEKEVEEETVTEKNAISGEELYADVLESYKEFINSTDGFEAERESGFYGMNEALLYEGSDAIGYTIMDINNDNIPELFIANINEPGTGKGHGQFIYAMWSIVDSKPALIFEGFARNSYALVEGNKFLNLCSSGAMYSGYGICTYEPGADSLSVEKFYFTDETAPDSGEIAYYTNTTGEWDADKAELLANGEDVFWDTYDGYCEKTLSLELQYIIQKDKYGVGANYAGKIYDNYDAFEKYIIDESEYSTEIVVYATDDVKDLRISKIYFEDVDEKGDFIFSSEGLYSYEKFGVDNPIILKLSFPGDTPAYGISFTDKDGAERNLGIGISGKDGSIELSDVVLK